MLNIASAFQSLILLVIQFLTRVGPPVPKPGRDMFQRTQYWLSVASHEVITQPGAKATNFTWEFGIAKVHEVDQAE
jgi:hypothetical protein